MELDVRDVEVGPRLEEAAAFGEVGGQRAATVAALTRIAAAFEQTALPAAVATERVLGGTIEPAPADATDVIDLAAADADGDAVLPPQAVAANATTAASAPRRRNFLVSVIGPPL